MHRARSALVGQQREQVVADPLDLRLLRARMTRKTLRPFLQEGNEREHARAPAAHAVELAHQLHGVGDGVALALEAAGLADDAVEVDVTRSPQSRLRITDRLARPRHPNRLTRLRSRHALTRTAAPPAALIARAVQSGDGAR